MQNTNGSVIFSDRLKSKDTKGKRAARIICTMICAVVFFLLVYNNYDSYDRQIGKVTGVTAEMMF